MVISTREDLLTLLEGIAQEAPKRNKRGTVAFRNLASKGPLAFLFTLDAPLSREELNIVQGTLGRSIPDAYSHFLTNVSNGCWLYWSTVSLFGACRPPGPPPHELQTPNTLELPDWAEDSELVIGSYSRDDALIVASNVHRRVTCRDRETGDELSCWNDFDDFLSREIARVQSLLGENPELSLSDHSLRLAPGK